MWYKTDLMEQILTSESAKQMIDYVSPIYGKSRIGLWEKEYGITSLPDQTIEQRRTQISQMRIKRPLNPKRFEKIIEALSGVETKLIENTAKNTFQVNLYGEVNNYDEVVRRIEELKPAHLLCDIRVSDVIESETALNYAIVSGSCEYSSSIVSEV